MHGLIHFIDTKANVVILKKFTCKGLCGSVYLSEAQNPIPPPPLYTVYVYTVYLFTQGRGGGGRVEPERRLEEQQFTQSWVEIPT
jgi:hypothetical protein